LPRHLLLLVGLLLQLRYRLVWDLNTFVPKELSVAEYRDTINYGCRLVIIVSIDFSL